MDAKSVFRFFPAASVGSPKSFRGFRLFPRQGPRGMSEGKKKGQGNKIGQELKKKCGHSCRPFWELSFYLLDHSQCFLNLLPCLGQPDFLIYNTKINIERKKQLAEEFTFSP
ncbi:hypothetical protein RI662_00005, partial [Brevibacillus agri]|uniref:hypothetical protein n=1 Tax=Brevibacillus agri TaxID=51101 RepID=UPI00286FB791